MIARSKTNTVRIGSNHKIKVLSTCRLLMLLALVACGSGGGGEEVIRVTSTFPPVVFTADKDTDGVVELYASFNDGTEIIKLSGTMVSGGNVVAFAVSPDGIYVAYVADQDTDDVFELYAVPVDKTPAETAVKISGSMAGSGIKEIAAGSGDYFFAWAPDSSRVAYIADQNAAGVFELFTSTPDGSDNVRVSGALVSGGDVLDFEWGPASALIAYVADQDTVDVQELYVSPADSNTPNVPVSGPMAGSGIRLISEGVYAFAWSPDSAWLAYIADQVLITKFELFTARPSGINNVQVSGPLDSNRDVDSFAWSPQSDQIVYRANQDILTALELYTAYPDIALRSQHITSGFDPGENTRQFGWSPTIIDFAQRIAFIADKDIPGLFQLYTTSPNNSNNVLVSSVTSAGGNVNEFTWAPNGELLAYRGETPTTLGIEELFTTRRTLPEIRRLSFLVPSGGDVLDFAWAPNGSRIAYRADQLTDNKIELFTNTPRGDQISNKRISGSLPPGGDVTEFQWAPDSSGVGYIADQNTDNTFELFASLPAGGDNTLLSGSLVSGGNVFAFEWVP